MPEGLLSVPVAAGCCFQRRGRQGVSGVACRGGRRRYNCGKCRGTPTGKVTQFLQGFQCCCHQGAALQGDAVPADPAKVMCNAIPTIKDSTISVSLCKPLEFPTEIDSETYGVIFQLRVGNQRKLKQEVQSAFPTSRLVTQWLGNSGYAPDE